MVASPAQHLQLAHRAAEVVRRCGRPLRVAGGRLLLVRRETLLRPVGGDRRGRRPLGGDVVQQVEKVVVEINPTTLVIDERRCARGAIDEAEVFILERLLAAIFS